MKNLQSSLEVEEKFVADAVESLESLPTATATHELDVSIAGTSDSFHTAQVLCRFVYILLPHFTSVCVVSELLSAEEAGGELLVCASEISCKYEISFRIFVTCPPYIMMRKSLLYFIITTNNNYKNNRVVDSLTVDRSSCVLLLGRIVILIRVVENVIHNYPP